MRKLIRIAEINAQMKLIIRILEDLVPIDGTTSVHLKYLTEYEDLKNERKELENNNVAVAA